MHICQISIVVNLLLMSQVLILLHCSHVHCNTYVGCNWFFFVVASNYSIAKKGNHWKRGDKVGKER
jgi:hypothetical protein